MKKFLMAVFLGLVVPSSFGAETGDTPNTGEEMIAPDLAGSVKLGYGSRYEYRGMVARDTGSGGLVFEGDLRFEPQLPLMMAFTYRDMKVENNRGQTNFVFGLQKEMPSSGEEARTTTCLGYQLVSGGLPGIMKGWERNGRLDAEGGTNQEFILNFSDARRMEYGTLFSSLTGGYSFAGLEGWYLSAGVGFEYSFRENIAASLSANVSWSFDYWTRYSGCDQLNVLLSVPVTVREACILSPFIMVDWGGRGAKMLNREAGKPLVENFAVVSGVRFMVVF